MLCYWLCHLCALLDVYWKWWMTLEVSTCILQHWFELKVSIVLNAHYCRNLEGRKKTITNISCSIMTVFL